VDNLLGTGKDSDGNAGARNKWVTLTWNLTPRDGSYNGTACGTNLKDDTALTAYYLAIPGGIRAGSAELVYYIKDVALVDIDGTTTYPATAFADEDGYYGADHPTIKDVPALTNGAKLKDLSFNTVGTAGQLKREMAPSPEEQ